MAKKQNYAAIGEAVKKAVESWAMASYELASYDVQVLNETVTPALNEKGVDTARARLNENVSLSLDQFDRAAIYRKVDDELGVTMSYDGIGGLAEAIVSGRREEGERAAKVVLTAYGLKSFGDFPALAWDEISCDYAGVKVSRKIYKAVLVREKVANDATVSTYTVGKVDRMITRVSDLSRKQAMKRARRKAADYVRAWLIDHLERTGHLTIANGVCTWSEAVEKRQAEAAK